MMIRPNRSAKWDGDPEPADVADVRRAVVDEQGDDPERDLCPAVEEAGDDDQRRRHQQPGGELEDRAADVVLLGPVGVDRDVDRADREVREAEDDRVVAERLRHRKRGDQHRAHGREQAQPREPVVAVQGVRHPGVAAPGPPDEGEHQHPLAEPLPGRVLGHQAGDLGEGEDEDEVEEQLERRGAIVSLDVLGEGAGPLWDGPPAPAFESRLRRSSACDHAKWPSSSRSASANVSSSSSPSTSVSSAPSSARSALDRLEADARDLVLDAAGGSRVPVELERLVDGLERAAQELRAGDHDHATRVRAAGDQPLADARELRPPPRVHAPGAGQYSPGTSPTCASAPSRRSARATRPAIHSKRSCVPVSAARRGSPRRTRACPRGRPPPGRRPAARPVRSRCAAPRRPPPRSRGPPGPASKTRARGPGDAGETSPAARPRPPDAGSPPTPPFRTRAALRSPVLMIRRV